MKTQTRPLSALRRHGLAMAIFLAATLSGHAQAVTIVNTPAFAPAGGSGDSLAPIISPDGRYVLFASSAKNLSLNGSINPTPSPLPAPVNVYVRDRLKQTTTLVSISNDGNGAGNDDSFPTGISTNGRFALFESAANNLVAGDTNGVIDVFLRDLTANVTLLVSVSTNGSTANGVSRSSMMTPDGRFVAFVSTASNLTTGDTNGIPDIFVRDLQNGTTLLGGPGALPASAAGSSELPLLTPDGRYVAFYSTATNVIPGLTNSGEIYVSDLRLGTTLWASTNARPLMQNLAANAYNLSCNQSISDDGRFVTYEACPLVGNGIALRFDLTTGLTTVISTNVAGILPGLELNSRNLSLTPDGRFTAYVTAGNAININTGLAVWDAVSNVTTVISRDLAQAPVTNAIFDWPALTPDGRFAAFVSSATNLTTQPVAAGFHLYVRDLFAGSNTLIDADTNGVGSISNLMTFPRISDDGSLVAFESPDGRLVAKDNNRASDVFARNLATSSTELISAGLPGLPSLTPNASSILSASCLSTNGRFIVFWSEADNLTPADTNGIRDVFISDLLAGSNFLASVNTNGMSGNGFSTDPVISGNGRFASFTSVAGDLVTNNNNSVSNIFLRDLQAGVTTLVSLGYDQGAAGDAGSFSSSLSSDGRYVLYFSKAGNLVPGVGGNSRGNIFWRDMFSGTNRAITTFPSATTINVLTAAMTPDGQYIAYGAQTSPGNSGNYYVWSAAADHNIYTNTTATAVYKTAISPDGNQVLVYLTNELVLLNVATKGQILFTNSGSRAGCQFTADSQWLTYIAGTNQVYRYHVPDGSNLLVSAGANDVCDSPTISANGRFVAYRSFASNLVPNDANGVADIFLFDADMGKTVLVTASPVGDFAANGRSSNPAFSADGQTLVWQSWADNLAGQDYNQWCNVYALRSFATSSPGLGQPFNISGFSISSLASLGSSAHASTLIWPAGAGANYQVQFTDDLNPPQWHALTNAIRVLGTQGYLLDPSTNNFQRFYRILAF